MARRKTSYFINTHFVVSYHLYIFVYCADKLKEVLRGGRSSYEDYLGVKQIKDFKDELDKLKAKEDQQKNVINQLGAAYNDTAADVAIALINWTTENFVNDGVLYNVNVPNVPSAELGGISLTKKGCRRYRDKIRAVKSPDGSDAYWIGGEIEDVIEDGTDVTAIGKKLASVTPIHLDMTCFEAYKNLKDAGIENALGEKLQLPKI